MKEVYAAELIVSTQLRRGDGTKTSPIRQITQVFDKEGKLIAENDPVNEGFTATDLIHFARWLIENRNVAPNIGDIKTWLESI